MFYVLTDALRNPEDQSVIYAPGEVLSSGAVEYLAQDLGIDNFACLACTTKPAAIRVQKSLLTGPDCDKWLPHYAVSPELAEARANLAQVQEQAVKWEKTREEVDAAAFEVIKFAQWGLDRHYGIYLA